MQTTHVDLADLMDRIAAATERIKAHNPDAATLRVWQAITDEMLRQGTDRLYVPDHPDGPGWIALP